MFFNNKFNTFFGLNLTLVYTFPMCMTWRFHFPLRNYDFKGGTFINDRNGKLVANREEVLKVWEVHYSELLNHEGNMSDLELPNYVHEKVNVI